MEEKLGISKGTRNGDGAEVQKLVTNGDVMAEAAYNNMGVDFQKLVEAVAALQESDNGFLLRHFQVSLS